MHLRDLRWLRVSPQEIAHLFFKLAPGNIEARTTKPGEEELRGVSTKKDSTDAGAYHEERDGKNNQSNSRHHVD